MFDYYDGDSKPVEPSPENYKTCFRCSMRFVEHPREHICHDGATFNQRLEELNKKRFDKPRHYYDKLALTPQDKEFLKEMRINPDKEDKRDKN